MSKSWTQSFSGRVITPGCLQADQVSFADIPHALAQKCRFSGQLRAFNYSVAQHCVIGAEQIAAPFALAFLLHEVSEVYLPDVPTPIKQFLRMETESGLLLKWTELEDQHARAIFTALGLMSLYPLIDSPEVHAMDLRMLMTEKRDLMGPEPRPWGIDAHPLHDKITTCWSPEKAEALFVEAFERLSR